MMNATAWLSMLGKQGNGLSPMGVPAKKRENNCPLIPGEVVKSRQVLRVNKGDQQIFFYGTTLRKRKK